MLNAQTANQLVPQVVFKDRVCANIVQAYLKESKAKVIGIQLETTSKGYQCSLLAVHYHENMADVEATTWGQWQTCFVIFRADSLALARACLLIQPENPISLLAFSQRILPDDRPPLPKGSHLIRFPRYNHEVGWIFKMERGRDVVLAP